MPRRFAVLMIAALLCGTAPDAARASRADRFDALHAAIDAPRAPSSVSPCPVAGALSAYAQLAYGFDYGGSGNADYWMKTTSDFAKSGWALGRALGRLANQLPAGPVSASISGMAAELGGLDASGRGDSNYWMARAKDMAQRVTSVGAQLTTLAGSVTGADAPTVPLSAVLSGLAEVARSLDASGDGTAAYWMRTTTTFVGVGSALARSLTVLAGWVPSPLSSVLKASSGALGNLSQAGNGTAQYWMARAQGIAQQVRGVGQSLEELAAGM